MRLRNLGGLEFDLSRSLKVKYEGVIGLPIHDFLLVSNSNYVSNSHRLGVIATRRIFSYPSSLEPNFDPPHPPLARGDFFPESNGFRLGSEGRSPSKMKLIGSIYF